MRKALYLFAALMALPTAAQAQEAAERATAQALFDEGARLMRANKEAEACPKLEESLKLVDGLGTRGKLAECYEKTGRVASAWAMYREVEQLAGKRGERRRQQVAAKRAAKLEKELAYLTIKLSSDNTDVKVVRNDVEVGSGILGTPIAVDPGPQEITVTADGFHEWKTTVQVPHKGKETVEVPPLKKLPPPPPKVESKPLPVAGASSTPTVTEKKRSSWRTPTVIGLVSGGAALVGTGLVFGALANSKWNEAFDDGHCDDNNVCSSEGIDLTDSARSRATLSTVFVSVGLVAAGAGVALWLWPDGDSEGEQMSISPQVSGDEVGVSVLGRF